MKSAREGKVNGNERSLLFSTHLQDDTVGVPRPDELEVFHGDHLRTAPIVQGVALQLLVPAGLEIAQILELRILFLLQQGQQRVLLIRRLPRREFIVQSQFYRNKFHQNNG